MAQSRSELIDVLIDNLRGSTNDMGNECEVLGLSDIDDDVTSAVDDAIFCCTACGWWCDQSEESSEFADLDEWTCRDCAIEGGWDGE